MALRKADEIITPQGQNDQYDGAQVTVSNFKASIDRGISFIYSSLATVTSNGGQFNLLMRAPNTDDRVHLSSFGVQTSVGPLDVLFYRNVTPSSVGQSITTQNLNNISNNTHNFELWGGPTITDVGTEIDRILVPAGRKEGGLINENTYEWVANPQEYYLLRVINNSNDDADVAGKLIWTETTLPWYNE